MSRRAVRPRCSRISTRAGTSCRAATTRALARPVELCGGGVAGRVLPRRRPHVRPAGSARPAVVPGRAAPADARRADRLRSRQRGSRAQLAVGALAGRYEWREATLSRIGTRRSIAGSSTSSSLVRDDERTRLGYVTRVARRRRTASSRCRLQAVAGHAAGRSRCGRMSIGVLRRSAAAGAAARAKRPTSRRRSSCRRARSTPGRMLRSMDPGPERKFRLTQLLQRGGDFERVAFEEIAKAETGSRRARRASALGAATRGRMPFAPPGERQRPGATMPNRLAGETSPYLLQHADNPVDWYPWGEEALARARARGQADPAVDRLLRVPLVPRDGARVVRGSRRRGGDERRTSSTSRSTARSGPTSTRSTRPRMRC